METKIISERRKVMNNENRQLMEEVLKKNLESAIDATSGSDEEKAAFNKAMDAAAQVITLANNDDAFQEHTEKLEADKEKLEVEKGKIEIEREKLEIEKAKLESEKEHRANEEEFRKAETRKNWIFRGIEIVAAIATPLIINAASNRSKMKFADKCMDWEVNGGNAFTTTPGRSVKDFFRFK